ncbi:V-type proton ATPase subunit a, partial [Caligus rogercresseyi]
AEPFLSRIHDEPFSLRGDVQIPALSPERVRLPLHRRAGRARTCEFLDHSPELSSFQRKFVGEIKRAENLERILRFLEKECLNDGIPVEKNPGTEGHLTQSEENLLQVKASFTALKKKHLELLEMKVLLEKAQGLFSNKSIAVSDDGEIIRKLLGNE